MSSDFFNNMKLEDLLDDDEKQSMNQVVSAEAMSAEDQRRFKGSRTYRENAVSVAGNNSSKRTGVEQVFDLQGKNSFTGFFHNAIEHTEIDEMIYEDILSKSQAMQDTVKKGNTILPTFKYLYEDVFYALYKYDAFLLDEKSIHFTAKNNYEIIKSLIGEASFIQLRKSCRNDSFNAGYACELLGNQLIEMLEKAIENSNKSQLMAFKQLLQQEQQIADTQNQIKSLEDAINDMIAARGEAITGDPVFEQMKQQMGDLIESANEQISLAEVASKACDTLVTPKKDEIKNSVSTEGESLSNASFEIQKVDGALMQWGLSDESGSTNVDYTAKRELLDALRRSKKLEKLTNMVGHFKDAANDEQKKKSKSGKTDIDTVITGGDMINALPSEKMNLCNPGTKSVFYKRAVDNGLLQYKKSGKVSKYKGPIIACLDTSSSIDGQQELWEKAMACGMLEIAQLQKRDFACIIYSGKADEPIVIEKNEIAPDKIIQIAEVYHGGGTSFEAPLNKAMKMIDTSKWKDADVVLITDGQCGVSNDFLRRLNAKKEEKEFTVQGVILDIGGSPTSNKTMDSICDQVSVISEISEIKDPNSKVTRAIFGSI